MFETKIRKALRKYLLEIVLLLIVFCNIFLPPIPLNSEIALRIDDVLLIAVLPVIFLSHLKFKIDSQLKLFSFFIMVVIISTIHSYIFLGVPYSGRDVNEIFRIFKYLFIIIFIGYCSNPFLTRSLRYFFVVGSYIIIGIALIEFFNPFGLSKILGNLYSTPMHTEVMLHEGRLVITGGDPNIGGAIVLFFFVFNLFSYISLQNRNNLILSVLLFVVLLLTSSRTGLIACVFIILFIVLFSEKVRVINKLIIIISFLIISVLIIPYLAYISKGISSAMIGQNYSLLNRFVLWEEAFKLFQQSPFLGWGPAKGYQSTVIDGEYFLILRRYGLLGLISLLLLISYVPIKYIKHKKLFSNNIDLVIFGNTIFYFFLGVLILMITNNIFSGYQVYTLYLFLTSLVYRQMINSSVSTNN